MMLTSPQSSGKAAGAPVPRQPPHRRCIRLPLPVEVTAPGLARRVVRDACATWGLGYLTDTATLLVTEMTTNAVLHAQPPITLTATQDVAHLTVSVADGDARLPQPRNGPASGEQGNGLALIEAMADEWGTYRDSVGKTVWARLRLDG
jgi:anti-sigma regulatory factor (Ser/Thr protein kinase)